MGLGTNFSKSDKNALIQFLANSLAERITLKNGKLYIDVKEIKVTLPGKPGENGVTPVKGVDYFDGKDGKTPKKGVDYFDGKDGKTPVKGIDYKDGLDGYSPIKGKDYFDGKDAKPPAHKWVGTCLRFQNPDGTWGKMIDLKGDKGEKIKGEKGGIPAHEWKGTMLRFQNPDGTWGKFTDLKGIPGKSIKGDKGKTPVKGVDYCDGEPGKDAKLPDAEEVLVLKNCNLIIGAKGNVALEKEFQPLRIIKL